MYPKMISDHDGIFYYYQNNEVFYKQILNVDEIDDIEKQFEDGINTVNEFSSLATGIRNRYEINTPDFIKERLSTVLFDYLGKITISPFMKLYKQQCGGIKPHRDKSLYGDYKYTCLIYISDDFGGGKLSLKVARPTEELQEVDPQLKHKVYKITPKKEYGIIFNKSILHYADDVVDGSKNILLIDINSEF